MRTLLAVITLAAGGCQCLVPVDERADDGGGAAGGQGGGHVDAGGSCAQPAVSCTGVSSCTAGDTCWDCGAGTTPSVSCIEGHCVRECFGPRECKIDAAAVCLSCDSYSSCVVPTCTPRTCSVSIDTSSCPGLTSLTLSESTDSACTRTLTLADGDSFGRAWHLENGQQIGFFERAGGWCVGRPYIGPRIEWWCPSCRFIAAECD